MNKLYDRASDDADEMDSWVRQRFQITDESVDSFMLRNGYLIDSYQGFVARMKLALEWIKPRATVHTRNMVDEIEQIVNDLDQRTSLFQEYVRGEPMSHQVAPNEADDLRCEKARALFEQARSLHRLQPTLDAHENYKQKQRERGSKSGKLSEEQRKRVAQIFWDAKASGSFRGTVQLLENEFAISATAIRKIAAKYKPQEI